MADYCHALCGCPEHFPGLHRSDDVNRMRALLSWIDGACVDELPHMEIREAIGRWREEPEARDAEWRAIAIALHSELSWCVGYLEGLKEPVPSTVLAALGLVGVDRAPANR